MVPEAGSPRLGCQHDQVLVQVLFQVADCCFLAVSSHGGKGKGAEASYKGTNPNHEGSAFMT